MIIDFHSHLYPSHPLFQDHRPPLMFDAEALLAKQAEAGVDLAVISVPLFGTSDELSHIHSLETIKLCNDFLAGLSVKYPGRLVGFSPTVPLGGDDLLKELERAIQECRLKGIGMASSYGGTYLDAPQAFPFFELAVQYQVPVFIHPPNEGVGTEKMAEYRLVGGMSRPFDTTLTVARLIYSGIFEKLPDLKLVCAHVGGTITALAGRLDFYYHTMDIPSLGPPWRAPNILTKPPSEYIKGIYVDTMSSFQWQPVMCAIQVVGSEHVVLGSDYPPVEGLKRSVDLVRGLPISDKDKEMVLSGNARQLLELGKG